MRIEVIRGFLTAGECAELNSWTLFAVERGWLGAGVSSDQPTSTRLTSRMYGDRFVYPETVYAVDKRIRKKLGLISAPSVEGHGRDGIVVSCTYSGGDIYRHRDPRSFEGLATLRCNVVTQKPASGGTLYLEDAPIDLDVGDLHCYLASEHDHNVAAVQGDTPRILWMFGTCVPADDWNSGRIEVGLP